MISIMSDRNYLPLVQLPDGSYIGDLGSLRIRVSDETLITHSRTLIRHRPSGVVREYLHVVKLPINGKVTIDGGDDSFADLTYDADNILIISEQVQAINNADGEILNIIVDPLVDNVESLEFDFTNANNYNTSIKSTLKGIIFNNFFSGAPLDEFNHQVFGRLSNHANFIDGDDLIGIDAPPVMIPDLALPELAITSVYVVNDETEQLALEIQKGDVAIRMDQLRSYIAISSNNVSMVAGWQELLSPSANVISVNGQTSTVVLTTTDIAEGTNLYYTEARVTDNATVRANSTHRDATSGNPHQVTKADIGLSDVPNVDLTAAVAANSAKVGITPIQVTAIDINSSHLSLENNPHNVTKTQLGLVNVPNTDFTAAVAANTAKVGITLQQTTEITTNTIHSTTVGNPHLTNKDDIGLSEVPNIDLMASVAANTAKVGITPVQASAITVNTAKVGISTGQANAIIANTSHTNTTTGNPHQVTATEVGLGNVPNVDTTNASNITTGTLPTSVLPALAIVDIHVVADETEMLALNIQKGDIAVRNDLGKSFINRTGDNDDLGDWQELLAPTDLVHSVNGQLGVVVLTTSNILEGTNLYYTEVRVNANINVLANTAHRNITAGNPHQVTKTEVGLSDVPNVDFTTAVAANTIKVGITPTQALDIASNNAKVGITASQANAIIANTGHVNTTSGNPHNVTATDLGLENVVNVDLTADVAANTTHRNSISNPHSVTKTQVGLGNVPNTDFTSAITSTLAHVAITSGNPHAVTKAEIGLGNVTNVDFTATIGVCLSHATLVTGNPHNVTKDDIGLGNVVNINLIPDVINNTNHRNVITGNPHQVTKAEVGLGNVANVDTTNASNITSGTLPTSVLPALAIVDIHVVADETEMLTLTVQKGDVAVRTDENKSYIALNSTNATLGDWQLLATPIDSIQSVNGQTGTVVLTTDNITEGANLYYTEARVTANASVVTCTNHLSNTNNPHDVDKVDIGLSDVPNVDFTVAVAANTAHGAVVTGNPHQVTATEVGLGDVPNVDYGATIALNTSHRNVTSGNPHDVTKAEIGLGNVTNVDFTATIAANTAKVGITAGQANAIVANTAKVGITTGQANDITSNNDHRNIDAGNPHAVTKAEIGLGNVTNVDLSGAVSDNTSHRNVTSGNPHAVTKAEVGLGNVTNVDFTTAIAANTAHVAITSGNPHQVTASDIGLGNVANVDTTNASNITSGTLPSSVLPALAITDSYVVNSEAAMLTLSIQKGDIAIRTDVNKSFINYTNANASMADWYELATSSGNILSVNGQTGTVVLTTTNIAEGTNLYYTEARVTSNASVTANTAHRNITAGNPHGITTTMIGAETPAGAQLKIDNALAASKLHLTDHLVWYTSPDRGSYVLSNKIAKHTTYWCNIMAFHHEMSLSSLTIDITTTEPNITIDLQPDGLFKVTINDVIMIAQTKDVDFIVSVEYDGIIVTKTFSATIHNDNVTVLVGGLDNNDVFYRAATDPNTNEVIVVGVTNSDGVGSNDALICKLNTKFEVHHKKSYGGSSAEFFKDVCVGDDGFIYACGYTNTDGQGNYDALIVKFDSQLLLLERLVIGIGANDYLEGLAIDGDDIYCVGYTRSEGAGNNDALIIKLDTELSITNVTQKLFGHNGNDRLYSIAVDPFHEIIVVGETASGPGRNSLVLKFDSDLNLLHQKIYGTNRNEYLYDVVSDSNGNIFIVGKTSKDGNDGVILKLNTSFTLVGEVVLDQSNDNVLYGVTITNTDTVVVCGALDNPSRESGFILHLDNNLAITDSKIFGGSYTDLLRGATIDNNDNVIVVGETSSEGQSNKDGMGLKWYAGDNFLSGSYTCSYLSGLVLDDLTANTRSISSTFTDTSMAYQDASQVITIPTLTVKDSQLTMITGVLY